MLKCFLLLAIQYVYKLGLNVWVFMLLFLSLLLGVVVCTSVSVRVGQIVGNGSEQQLQRELEDVLMDPSVADTGLGSAIGMDSPVGGDRSLPTTASPVPPGSDPLSSPPPKMEMVLPVQTAQESELNERSYRGKL